MYRDGEGILDGVRLDGKPASFLLCEKMIEQRHARNCSRKKLGDCQNLRNKLSAPQTGGKISVKR